MRFSLPPATHSGACARCKNLKARSHAVSLMGEMLTKSDDVLLTCTGEM